MPKITSTKELVNKIWLGRASDNEEIINYINENKNNPHIINATFNLDHALLDTDVSVLMIAARKGNLSAVNALLNSPVIDINHTDKSGETALFYPLGHDYADCLQALLDKGIHFRVKNCPPNIIIANEITGATAVPTARTALSSASYLYGSTHCFRALIRHYAKWLLSINNFNEIDHDTLEDLRRFKGSLFKALMDLNDDRPYQFNIVKQIIEQKNTSILGLVFWHEKQKTSLAKGRMNAIFEEYKTFIQDELELLANKELQPANMTYIKDLLESENAFKLHDGLISTVLWKWILKADKSMMTPAVTDYFKKHCKDIFSGIIANLKGEEERTVLKMIFDAAKSDKRNNNTALAELYWHGHTNKDDTTTRLGTAYKRFKVLNGEPDVAVSVFSVFVNKLARAPELFNRASQSISSQVASSPSPIQQKRHGT